MIDRKRPPLKIPYIMAETLVMVGVRHLGRTIALHFARLGWEVVCVARTAADVEEVARAVDQAGGHGGALAADLTEARSLAALGARPTLALCIAPHTRGSRFRAQPRLATEDRACAYSL